MVTEAPARVAGRVQSPGPRQPAGLLDLSPGPVLCSGVGRCFGIGGLVQRPRSGRVLPRGARKIFLDLFFSCEEAALVASSYYIIHIVRPSTNVLYTVDAPAPMVRHAKA